MDDFPTFIEEASYEKGFSKTFEKEILPFSSHFTFDKKLHLERKKSLFVVLPMVFIWLSVLSWVLYDSLFINPDQDNFFFGVILLLFFGYILYMTIRSFDLERKSHSRKFKLFTLKPIIKHFDDIKIKDMEVKSFLGFVKNFSIVPKFKGIKLDDVFEWKSKETSFLLADVQFYSSQTVYYLKPFDQGLLLLFNANPETSFPHTYINRGIKHVDYPKLVQVELESEFIHSNVKIFSEDQIRSRVLLSTVFMEKLVAFITLLQENSSLNSKYQIEFHDSSVLIFIRSDKDHFEARLSKSTDLIENVKLIMREIYELIELGKSLDLEEFSDFR